MLRVDALTASATAIPVTFAAEPGTCTGLLGTGAVALLEVVAGLRPAVAGRVSRNVTGEDVAIMLLKTSAMDARLTAAEYLTAVAGARRASGQSLRRTPAEALRALALAPAAQLNRLDTCRGVALAAALLPAVPVVLLADPLAGVSPATRHGAIAWIHALADARAAVVAAFTAEGDARAVSHRVIRAEATA